LHYITASRPSQCFEKQGCARNAGLEAQTEALVATEPVDRDSYVAVMHDSFGERYVDVALVCLSAVGPEK
jgi:hypothetical protein